MLRRSAARTALAAALLCAAALAADSGQALLDAAAHGQAERVRALLDQGAAIEAQDNNGRTPLMLAAQHGHADTVQLLLAKGASAMARDRRGATAYVLALFSPSGPRLGIEAVLKALPAPKRPRLVVDAAWSRENLYSSCALRPDQLVQHVGGMEPDGMIVTAFRAFFAASGKNLVDIVRSATHGLAALPSDDAFHDADAVLSLEVRPSAACVPQGSYDNLGLAIDVQLWRARDRAVLLKKTFGAGLKGLHAVSATSPTQYFPMYEGWTKSHAEQIYWAAVEAWMRAAP
ncbi:MAG TPA: ankyrin repeat domain-containing protein [Bryobacteraceae bacterium]|nr:ankyrin repeat domain-containing protein [Bryobacteraceae bacterium]